ncbi:type IV pilus assembly protein PilX [Collimonas sp. PA-H2]|uniref:pilus assembly PilX family protein n=1 Tax=Collimonas sp. PA-H2 TaxID=1881062 RepID=UPI000BF9BBD1|nr:PilX N-terminal domain-containing pilus assembly protein [Collimonas sp. PA-H2]PFH09702.1 type IV pilus assembly protein PilX [Collimonas sp. PA-H2]
MKRVTPCLQRGAVLPMLLISLLVMAFLGFNSLNTALLEEKMAANAGSRQLAFQAAEHALRFCENQLQLTPVTIPQLRQGPVAADGANGMHYWEMADSWRNDKISIPVPRIGTEGLAPAAPARCLAEHLELDADLQFQLYAPQPRPAFRITARGVGASNAAVVLLQSYLLL